MKRTLILILFTVFGCSIIPDDAFENPPRGEFKGLVIEGRGWDEVNNKESLIKLSGTVTKPAANKFRVALSGDLDPFHFAERLNTMEYELNEASLVSNITLSFEGGRVITEDLTYESTGKLMKSVWKTGTEERTHDFIYVNNKLDRINKSVKIGNTTQTGFFQRYEPSNRPDFYHEAFYSVYPYNPSLTVPLTENYACSYLSGPDIANANYLNTNYYQINTRGSFPIPYFAIVVPESTTYRYDSNQGYNDGGMGEYPLIGLPKMRIYTGNLCGQTQMNVNIYSLLPINSFNHQVLQMISLSDERTSVVANPGRLSNYNYIEIKFEYTFSK